MDCSVYAHAAGRQAGDGERNGISAKNVGVRKDKKYGRKRI